MENKKFIKLIALILFLVVAAFALLIGLLYLFAGK